MWYVSLLARLLLMVVMSEQAWYLLRSEKWGVRSVATFLSVLQSFPLSEHLPLLSLVTVQTLRQSEGGTDGIISTLHRRLLII